MINRCSPAAAVLLSLLSIAHASAQTSEPIIVTATRTAQTADEALSSVTVITRSDIERRQAQTVADILQGTPGLELSNSGGPGEATSVFLRGTNSDHVLVLIDGVRVGSPALGTTPFQYLSADQIERIEIVRGPRSSLYGSQAIGGVIQIFTRKGGGRPAASLSAGAGNYQTTHLSAAVSGGGKKGWYNLTASRFDTGGINSCQGNLNAGCFTIEPDRDGYLNTAVGAHAGYHFSKGVDLDLHWLRAQGHNQYDGTSSNQTDFVNQTLGGHLAFNPLASWYATLTAGTNQDDEDNLLDGVFNSRFNTERTNVVWQNDLSVTTKQLVTVGLSYSLNTIHGSVPYAETSRSDQGLFVQYQGTFGKNRIQLAARHDINQQFGAYTTGSAAWGYKLRPGLRLAASYGTAFKAPTFNDLYYPGFGNPNLRPERSRSAELDLKGSPHWGSWSVGVYQTRIDQLIAFDPVSFLPANVSSARIRGMDGAVSTRLAGWDLSASLTLLRPENRDAGADHDNILPRRAEAAGRVAVDRTLGKLSLGATVLVQGRRYDNLANTRRLGGYTLIDLRAAYAIAKEWQVQGRVANLLDKRYETAAFFNQLGRNFMITLNYRPTAI